MPEVISLLSSSPLPILSTKAKKLTPRTSQRDLGYSDFSLDEDAFNDVLDPAFTATRSAKRRRLSPDLISKHSIRNHQVESNAVFDLSSEGDIELPQISLINSDSPPEVNRIESLNNGPSTSVASISRTRYDSKSKQDCIVEILSDDFPPLEDPILTSSQVLDFSRTINYSKETANILATLKVPSKGPSITKKAPAPLKNTKVGSYAKSTKVNKATTVLEPASKIDDNIQDSSQAEPNPVETPITDTSANSATNKKQPKSQKTLAEKDADKEKKKQEKEQKAAEKQLAADLAEANKAKTNKKIAAKDMQIELPNTLKGKSVSTQLEEFMREAGALVNYYEEHTDMTKDPITTTGHLIRWKRKVEAEYEKSREEWVPIARPKVQLEKHVLVYLTAEEFCTIAACGTSGQSFESNLPPDELAMKKHMDGYIQHLRAQYQQTTIVILIQGLTAYLKKSANAKNREFAAAVRNQAVTNADEEAGTSNSMPKRSQKRKSAPAIDLSFFNSDHAEAIQLHLQLHHRPLNIVHTTSPHTTAYQIFTLTQHLATRPYRLAAQQNNLAHASFCMDGGQIKTGQGDARETFILMLQEVNRVTVSMAHGVLSQGYEGPASLVKAFKDVEQKEGKEASRLMLKDARKAMNQDGGLSDKPLGQMVSKRLYKVFMSRDENLRDGIV